MTTRARWLIAALAFLLPAVSLAAETASPAFDVEFKKVFAKWDLDKNGTLSAAEIDKAVGDPSVKGPEAAVIVALRRASRSKKFTMPPITQATAAEFAVPGKEKDRPDLNAYYTSALKKIQAANHDLFPKGAPNLESLHQGKLGDCFCLAPLGATICRNPQDVVKMIQKESNGSYVVHLGKHDIHVPALTDAEIAITASTGADGVWVNVYEKAIALYRLEKAKASGQTNSTAFELLGKGGSAGSTVELVTGHAIERFSCKFAKEKISEKEKHAKLDEFRSKLAAAFESKRLVTTGTGASTATTPPGITSNHAYAIIGYDAKSDQLTVWNPHGNNFTPKGNAGLQNGYATKDGRFHVPTAEFVQIFAGVAIETAHAAK